MKNIVLINDNEIRLNSLMDEVSFGKTNYDSIITQQGIIASGRFLNNKYDFSLSSWNFSEVKSFETEDSDKRFVFYCGNADFITNKTKCLSDFFENASTSSATQEEIKQMREVCFAFICFLTKAAEEKIEIPLLGPGGIIVDFKENKDVTFLFLPQDLYKYSVGGLNNNDFSILQGYFINPSLSGLPSICFTRAVIAYKMITNSYPFTETDVEKRNLDILDRKFLPIQFLFDKINSKLEKAINKGLKINANIVDIPGKKKRGKSNEDLTPTPDFPVEELSNQINEPIVINTTLSEKASLYVKSQNAKIGTKRKLKRNATTIFVSLGIAAVAGLLIANVIKSNLEEFTSIGLTSEQTVQAFYKGMNDKDSVLMSNMLAKGTKQHQVDTISNIFVIHKQRLAFNKDKGFLTPEEWILWSTNREKEKLAGLYGISNVYIDGKLSELNPTLYMRKEKDKALTHDKNIELKDGMESVHKVEYYLLHSEGEENDIIIDYIEEIIKLVFKKNRWVITEIQTKSTPVEINTQEFKNTYFNLIVQNDYDVLKTAHQMRFKYPWIPEDEFLLREKERQENQSSDPFGFIDAANKLYQEAAEAESN